MPENPQKHELLWFCFDVLSRSTFFLAYLSFIYWLTPRPLSMSCFLEGQKAVAAPLVRRREPFLLVSCRQTPQPDDDAPGTDEKKDDAGEKQHP